MDGQDLLRMFTYDYWANRESLKAMRAAGNVSEDVIGRMAHILSAQKLWLERIQRQNQSMPVWPTATIDQCSVLADEMSIAWQTYLTRIANQFAPESLSTVIDYRNSKGEPCLSRVGRHLDPCALPFGVSSRADCLADADLRRRARIHRFHPRCAEGLNRLDLEHKEWH